MNVDQSPTHPSSNTTSVVAGSPNEHAIKREISRVTTRAYSPLSLAPAPTVSIANVDVIAGLANGHRFMPTIQSRSQRSVPRRARDARVDGETSPPVFSERQLGRRATTASTRRRATRADDAGEVVDGVDGDDGDARMVETTRRRRSAVA